MPIFSCFRVHDDGLGRGTQDTTVNPGLFVVTRVDRAD